MSNRVAVCIASYGYMKTVSACSLAMSTNFLRTLGHDLTLHARQGPYTHWNRDQLVADAERAGAEYVMFIDTDVVYPPDGIARLLDAKKDVIGGMYNMKQIPPTSTIKLSDGNGGYREVKDHPLPDSPFRVAALGTGFLLIKLAAIAELERPLFPCVEPIGEDIAFCKKAEAAGIEIWCDPTIRLEHIGDYAY